MNRQGPADATPAEIDSSRRRFFVPGKRAAGLIALAVLPILAISGLTSMRAEVGTAAAALTLDVDYPRVLRYLEPTWIRVAVGNPGAEPARDVLVALEHDYLDAFTGLSLMPEESWIGPDGFVVEFDEILPGDSRFIHIELRGNRYWWHPGEISAAAGDALVSLRIGTLMLP